MLRSVKTSDGHAVLLVQRPVAPAILVLTRALWAGRGAGWPGHPVPPTAVLAGSCMACVWRVSATPLPGPRLRLCSLWMETRTVHWSPQSAGLSLRTVEKDFIKMEVRTPSALIPRLMLNY